VELVVLVGRRDTTARRDAGAGNSADVCGALAQAWFALPVALYPELMAELDAIKREHIGGLMSSRPRE
jgi:hypothetical protein